MPRSRPLHVLLLVVGLLASATYARQAADVLDFGQASIIEPSDAPPAALGVDWTDEDERDYRFAWGLFWAFSYADAADVFRSVQSRHQKWAMPYVGEALCAWQGLWMTEFTYAGRQAVLRLKSNVDAASDREKMLVQAVTEAFFVGGNVTLAAATEETPIVSVAEKVARDDAFLYALDALHRTLPFEGDRTVDALLGMAYLRKVDVGLYGFGERTHQLEEAIEVLEGALEKSPSHAGLLHMLVHAHDTADRAADGLVYGHRLMESAPDNSHAKHMVSHLSLRVGDMDAVIADNWSAYLLSLRYVSLRSRPLLESDTHALEFMHDGLVHAGRMKDAADTAHMLAGLAEDWPSNAGLQARVRLVLSQYVLTAEQWQLASARESNAAKELYALAFQMAETDIACDSCDNELGWDDMYRWTRKTTAGLLYAVGLAAVREESSDLVSDFVERLETLAADLLAIDAGDAERVRIASTQLLAHQAIASGDMDLADALLADAADAEAALGPAPYGSDSFTSALDDYAHLLLQMNRADEVGAVLARAAAVQNMNRPRSLFLAGSTQRSLGDTEAACAAFTRLLLTWSTADATHEEAQRVLSWATEHCQASFEESNAYFASPTPLAASPTPDASVTPVPPPLSAASATFLAVLVIVVGLTFVGVIYARRQTSSCQLPNGDRTAPV